MDGILDEEYDDDRKTQKVTVKLKCMTMVGEYTNVW